MYKVIDRQESRVETRKEKTVESGRMEECFQEKVPLHTHSSTNRCPPLHCSPTTPPPIFSREKNRKRNNQSNTFVPPSFAARPGYLCPHRGQVQGGRLSFLFPRSPPRHSAVPSTDLQCPCRHHHAPIHFLQKEVVRTPHWGWVSVTLVYVHGVVRGMLGHVVRGCGRGQRTKGGSFLGRGWPGPCRYADVRGLGVAQHAQHACMRSIACMRMRSMPVYVGEGGSFLCMRSMHAVRMRSMRLGRGEVWGWSYACGACMRYACAACV